MPKEKEDDYRFTFTYVAPPMTRRKYLQSIVAFGSVTFGLLPLLGGCSAKTPITEKDFWEKRMIIAELADMIIPTTDTPGAKAASVELYIINVLLHCTDTAQQRIFMKGIIDLEKYSLKTFGLSFLQCTLLERHEVLKHFANEETRFHGIMIRVEKKLLGPTFFAKLRALTVEGYCVSKQGATQALAYIAVPGGFQACTSLQPHQKAWAIK